jgi:ATP-dependent Clp protease ATP-binding subunit ClpA
VGPTGVGKTELVKRLSQELFDSNEPLIRLDMTEYMEKHSVARMIGSPPGYVGYDEAGQLTEKVRRKPYSVILFDEIEKAHPDVMNILMQILDEGKIDDAQGRTVSFENTVICMTSNAGSTDKSVGVGFNRTESEISKEKAMKGLREFLRPEFISRIDEIVVFKSLTKEDFKQIAALMLDEMKEPLAEKEIGIQYDDAALTAIAEEAFGKSYGARDIRRVIRQKVEDQVAELIIAHSSEIKTLQITAQEGKLVVTYQ